MVCLHCRIARGSGQPGDFDASGIIVFAASDRAAWRRSIGSGIGAIVVYGSAPTAHSIAVPCPPASDEDIAALAGAALGSPSVMSKSAIYSRRPSAGLWPSAASEARVDKLSNELAGERTARQADQDQLTAARAAADKATAELVALAQRLAEIVEAEPPRRGRLGRAWGWFLRN